MANFPYLYLHKRKPIGLLFVSFQCSVHASLSVQQILLKTMKGTSGRLPVPFYPLQLTSYGALFEYEFCYAVNVTEELLHEEEPYLANYDVILEVHTKLTISTLLY